MREDLSWHWEEDSQNQLILYVLGIPAFNVRESDSGWILGVLGNGRDTYSEYLETFATLTEARTSVLIDRDIILDHIRDEYSRWEDGSLTTFGELCSSCSSTSFRSPVSGITYRSGYTSGTGYVAFNPLGEQHVSTEDSAFCTSCYLGVKNPTRDNPGHTQPI